MDFRLVVFDLAGTTVKDNKDVHKVLQSALRKNEVEITIDDANEVMGIPKPIAIGMLLEKRHIGNRPITDAWVNDIHRQFVQEMRRFYEKDPSVGEKPGVSETFLRLKKRGIKIAVDTGFDRPVTLPLLKRLGWIEEKLIDFSITSDEVQRGRPHPDMIFEAMMQTGVSDPKQVIKVGDTVSDLREGRAAGCGLVIGVTSGAFSAIELQKENPDYLIEHVPAILDLID